MKNKIFILLSCGLLSSALTFSKESDNSADQKLDESKNVLISNHVDYAKASIDQKCQKLKKKIRKFEDNLHSMNKYDEEDWGSDPINIEKRRKELTNKIKKCEDKLEALKTMKLSLEIIDFQSL